MSYKLAIAISQALMFARWKQTLIAAIGVMVGVSMFVALLSFMGGLNSLLDGLVLNRTPHVRLFMEIKPNPQQPIQSVPEFKKYHSFVNTVKADNVRNEIYNSIFILKSLHNDLRTVGSTPRVTAPVFFSYGVTKIDGILTGIDVGAETHLFSLSDYIVQGNPLDLTIVPNSIILGRPLADKLQVGIGDMAHISTSTGERYVLKVVGFFQSGLNEIDKVQCYVSVYTAQKVLSKPAHYITEIAVKLKDMSSAPPVAKEYGSLYGTQTETIQAANAQFETGSKVRSIISYAVGITLLLVAGFGIYNILNMMIYEKMDTIAILKATGFSGKDVKQVFILLSMSIGLVGGGSGLVLGLLFSKLISYIPFKTEALPTVKTYPVDYEPLFYLIGISFALITTYVAGILPANKAGKADPIVIIRGK